MSRVFICSLQNSTDMQLKLKSVSAPPRVYNGQKKYTKCGYTSCREYDAFLARTNTKISPTTDFGGGPQIYRCATEVVQYLLGVRYLFVDSHEDAVGHDNEHHKQTEERNDQC